MGGRRRRKEERRKVRELRVEIEEEKKRKGRDAVR